MEQYKSTILTGLAVITFFCVALPARAAGWVTQSSGTTVTLRDVHFVDSTTGWAVGDSGTILKTSNGGASWTPQTSGTTRTLHDVDFVDADNGYAVGDAGTVRRTVNGGSSWISRNVITTKPLYGVDFLNANTGWVVGGDLSGALIRRTIDGGSSWTTQTAQPGAVLLHDIKMVTSNYGLTAGVGDQVGITENSGDSWSGEDTGTRALLYNDLEIAGLRYFAVGDNGIIAYTTEPEVSWFTWRPSSTSRILYGIDFISVSAGWVVGENGTMLRTTDSGTSWNAQPSGTTSTLYAVHFSDASNGWAVGASGTILRYDAVAPTPPTTLTLDGPGDGTRTNDTTPRFTWSAATDNVAIASYEYSLDDGAWVNIGNKLSTTLGTPLPQGSHDFALRARDSAANPSSMVVLRFTIDTAAPNTSITLNPPPSTTLTSAAFEFNATETSTFTCTLDGSSAACASPRSYPGLAAGNHTFTVYATDTAGNADGSPATYGWIITAPAPPAPAPAEGDTTSPDTAITAAPALNTTSTSASFSFTATEIATFGCALDSDTFSSCTSPRAYSGLAIGTHTFKVRAVDSAGNTDASPASYGWTVTTPAPPVPEDTVAPAPAPTPTPTPTPTPAGEGTTPTGSGTVSTPATPSASSTASTPSTPSSGGPPFTLAQMETDAGLIVGGELIALLDSLHFSSAAVCQMSIAEATARVERVFTAIGLSPVRAAIINFTACGTASTLHLGAGERLGVVNSYKAAFGRLPSTAAHWFDIAKIGNGRFPGEQSKAAEVEAETRFRKIYLRAPDRSGNQNDKSAVIVMAYGLRPLPRNLNSERAAISIFKGIFGYAPSSATDWDAVRAVAYSGAIR